MDSFEYEGSFFDQFPPKARSYIMNLFCLACREFVSGEPSPEELLDAMRARVLRALIGSPRTELLEAVKQSLESEEARAVAAFVVLRESLPLETRQRLKAAAKIEYRERWMREQKPTSKQLAYLKKLGCKVVPTSLSEASALIDRLVKARQAA